MNQKDIETVNEPKYSFIGLAGKAKRAEIISSLSNCKEIRDTAYPLTGSTITELAIVEFTARKEKDLVYVNGTLSISDGEKNENRSFEAYIMKSENKNTRVYMDITRLNVTDEPRLIRTTDEMVEDEHNVLTVTSYSQMEAVEEKIFTSEFPKINVFDYVEQQKNQQISAL